MERLARVRLVGVLATPKLRGRAGEVLSVSHAMAAQLVAGGHAFPVDDEPAGLEENRKRQADLELAHAQLGWRAE